MIDLIRRAIEPLARRIALMVGRAIITRVIDADGIQSLQLSLLNGETRDGVERLQEYGFTSVPKDGSAALALFVGGNREHGVVIAVDDKRYRLKGLEQGEVALYTDEGDAILMRRNNTVEVRAQKVFLGPETAAELGGGVVTVMCQCAYTGAIHPIGSSKVKAQK